MPQYKFEIVAAITVTAETQDQARRAAMDAKLGVPEALERDWPALVKPGRTKLVPVPKRRAKS